MCVPYHQSSNTKTLKWRKDNFFLYLNQRRVFRSRKRREIGSQTKLKGTHLTSLLIILQIFKRDIYTSLVQLQKIKGKDLQFRGQVIVQGPSTSRNLDDFPSESIHAFDSIIFRISFFPDYQVA